MVTPGSAAPGTIKVDASQMVTQRRTLDASAPTRPYAAPTTSTTTLNANHTPEFKMKCVGHLRAVGTRRISKTRGILHALALLSASRG